MLDTSATLLAKRAETVESDVMRPSCLNRDVDWNAFDPVAYRNHNYLTLRDDDHQIMVKIREFFAEAKISNGRGVDVGAGSNLYPALAMLPFCRRLDLHEWAPPNVAWLKQQVRHYDDSWDAFWDVYRTNPAYATIHDPRAQLAATAIVTRTSIFQLRKRTWDMGTMFFVACSLSNSMAEFHQATHRFVRSLRPGAPFAAAFMEASDGYPVGRADFPAVRIQVQEVAESLASVAYDDLVIERITSGDAPLRPGYSGVMILARGRAAG